MLYTLAHEHRDLSERTSLHRLDRQRAYLHFLLACCEDGPFIVLNMLLVLIQLNDKLELKTGCQEWLAGNGDPTIILVVFMMSVASLAYKATHLVRVSTFTLTLKSWHGDAKFEPSHKPLQTRPFCTA